MNITGYNLLCEGKNCSGIVCENDLCLSSRLVDKLFVIFNVVNTGKSVLFISEKLTVFLKGENVLIGINALFVKSIKAYKMISDLV